MSNNIPINIMIKVMMQQMMSISSRLVRGRRHGVPLRGGAPLQHGGGALRRAEAQHQRPVCVRADA